jgi:8-oxo-dGTP pyrophosphatase MutT (NUDIX family)
MATEAVARPAATILLLRDGKKGLEVFMVVRHHAIDFAAGALVFPGGRVEDGDHALAERMGGTAFQLAAIRETFEECGVLLARSHGASEIIDADTLLRVENEHRAALNASEIEFGAILDAHGMAPATDLLVHYAHWITPAHQPKRYDTQFYLAEAPAAHVAVHDGHESVDSIWITPQDALTGTEEGRYILVFATQMNLAKLARYATVAEAMAAARSSTVVTVQPRATKLDETRRKLLIPIEAGYGGSEFIVDLPPASS